MTRDVPPATDSRTDDLPPDASFRQRLWGVRTCFDFQGDALEYRLEGPSGSRTLTVECGAVEFDTGRVVRRPSALLVLAAVAVCLGIAQGAPAAGAAWGVFAAACVGAWWFAEVPAVLLFSERGELHVLEDGFQEEILAEIDARRRDQLRHWHAQIDFGNDPDREIEKFRWLRSHEVISETELAERISAIAQSAPLYGETEGDYGDEVLH